MSALAALQRRTLLALPFVSAAVIAFALLVVGAARPYLGARLYGGPTESVDVLAFRIEAVERLQEWETPLRSRRVRVEAAASGSRRVWRGLLDASGMAYVSLPWAASNAEAVRVRVSLDDGSSDRSLADGPIELSARDWLRAAKSHGGWLDGRRTGPLHLDVAARRGVFAVPFADGLLLRALDSSGAAVAAEWHLEGEGVSIELPRNGALLDSDQRGFAEARIRPLEHAAALHVVARARSGEQGEWYATLPIIPGALHAELTASKLRIESPIVRDAAYFALLTAHARVAGGTVRLTPDGRGGAVGFADLPRLPSEPIWALVSSEPDLNSPSAVGWPLVAARVSDEPAKTFRVPEQLLLDGVVQGFARDEQRKRRARLLAGGFSALAATLMALLVIQNVRAADARIAAHLEQWADGEREDARRPRWPLLWALVVAVSCILLGFAAVALIAMYRI